MIYFHCHIRPERLLYDAERHLLAIAEFLVIHVYPVIPLLAPSSGSPFSILYPVIGKFYVMTLRGLVILAFDLKCHRYSPLRRASF